MNDLISRAELFNRLAPVQTLAEAYAVIQGMPSADPEIIRCRDCKHFGGGTYCYERDDMWDENDFCSYAERKEQ